MVYIRIHQNHPSKDKTGLKQGDISVAAVAHKPSQLQEGSAPVPSPAPAQGARTDPIPKETSPAIPLRASGIHRECYPALYHTQGFGGTSLLHPHPLFFLTTPEEIEASFGKILIYYCQ